MFSQQFKKNDLKSQNLLIVSFPKSGRSWLRVMMDDLSFTPDFSHAGVTIEKYNHYSDALKNIENFFPRKIIFLSRDPRDAIVSYFFQLTSRLDVFDGTIHEFIKHEKHGIRTACLFNTGWIKNAHKFSGFFHLKYEDLIEEPENTLTKTINFIGIEKKQRLIRSVIQNNSIEEMRKKEKEGILEKRFPNKFSEKNSDDNSMKVRKGKVGGYKEYLSEEDIHYCNQVMAEYGYNPDFYNQRTE